MSKLYNLSEYKLRTKTIIEKLHKRRSSYISYLPFDILNIIICDCCLSQIRTFNNHYKFKKYINLKREDINKRFIPKYFKIIFPDNTFHITEYSAYRRFIGDAFELDDNKIYAINPNDISPGFMVSIWVLKEGWLSCSSSQKNIEYIKIQRLYKNDYKYSKIYESIFTYESNERNWYNNGYIII